MALYTVETRTCTVLHAPHSTTYASVTLVVDSTCIGPLESESSTAVLPRSSHSLQWLLSSYRCTLPSYTLSTVTNEAALPPSESRLTLAWCVDLLQSHSNDPPLTGPLRHRLNSHPPTNFDPLDIHQYAMYNCSRTSDG